MAHGGKRKGAGRKPLGKVPMLVRVSPEIRGAIERDAERSGQSLSAEAEAIFADALRERSRGDKQTRALAFLVSQVCETLRLNSPRGVRFDWVRNRTDFEALRSALVLLLGRLAPEGEVEATRYETEGWGRRRDGVSSPDAFARFVVAIMFKLISVSEDVDVQARFRRRGNADVVLYAIPQVAKVLGLKTRG